MAGREQKGEAKKKMSSICGFNARRFCFSVFIVPGLLLDDAFQRFRKSGPVCGRRDEVLAPIP